MVSKLDVDPLLIMSDHTKLRRGVVTRAELHKAVYRISGLSRSDSAAMVELVLKEIIDSLGRGETVKLVSFGSFMVRAKGQRIGRNPKTGKEALISPRRVLVFRPSKKLKECVNLETPQS